ncbi:MAG: hypothetical protein AAB473_03410 [Patescibacteria group bacterium]
MTLSSKIETGIVLVSGALLLLLLAGIANNILLAREGLFDAGYHHQTIAHNGPRNGDIDLWSEEKPYLCSYFKMHSDGAIGFHCTTGEYLKQEILNLPNILVFFLFGLPLLVIFTGTSLVLISEIKAEKTLV